MKIPLTHKHAYIVAGLKNSPEYKAGFDKTFKPKKTDNCLAVKVVGTELVPCRLRKNHLGDHDWANVCVICGEPKAKRPDGLWACPLCGEVFS